MLAEPDRAQGHAAIRLARSSHAWKRLFNHPLTPENFIRSSEALGLGALQTPRTRYPIGAPADLNVLLVFMESTYNKHLALFGAAEDTQPLLSQYRERMEIFPNLFSNYASSIHARFAAFSGLYPVQDFNEFTIERVDVKTIFDVMHNSGYYCSLFYSSYLDITGFRSFLAGRGLDEMYDADSMPGQRKTERVSWGLCEEETLEAMKVRLDQFAQAKQRFFMTYVPAAPHYPYDAVPERFRKFKPGDVGDYTPFYLNELLYMDWVLSSLLDHLKATGLLEKTLVVITDDHGEMLGGKGNPIGHGWMLTPELANAPLIIMDPRSPGYRVNYRPGSQVDLLPTLLETLNLQIPEKELYQGCSLYSTNQTERLVYLNSYGQFAILATNRMWIGDRDKLAGTEGNAFIFTNSQTKTFFTEVGTEKLPTSIRAFDKFQENLLRNYSYYRDALSSKGPAGRVALAQ